MGFPLDERCYNQGMKHSPNVEILRKQFDLTDDRWLMAHTKAKQLGLNLSEYLSLLIEEDTDPWGPVPQQIAKQWDQEEAVFWEAFAKGNVTVYSKDTLDEFIKDMSAAR